MKILVVDDHALIREALRSVLDELTRDADVLEAANCQDAMQLVAKHTRLDLILLDLSLPDAHGFDMIEELQRRYRSAAIVVLSASKDSAEVAKALDLGAAGYIPKSATRAVMIAALRLVLAGGVYVPPEIRPDQSAEVTQPASPSDLGLTDRQLEVAAFMMQGKSNKAICRELDVAEATVKNHVTAVLKALKVTSRTEAVIAIGKLGWKLPHPKA